MKRNEIIAAADRLRHALIEITPWSDSVEREKWALVGECERFGNDLCNAPTARNRQRGAIVYTVRDGQKRLSYLQAAAMRFFRVINRSAA